MSLPYDLALRLKNAGFKQGGEGDFLDNAGRSYSSVTPSDVDIPYFPILEELVDACGEEFIALCRWKELSVFWEARGDGITSGLYKTKSEAVAHLYLALNEKV